MKLEQHKKTDSSSKPSTMMIDYSNEFRELAEDMMTSIT